MKVRGGEREVPAVVHSAGALLAAGADCRGALSDCMAAAASLPPGGHCGGRSPGTGLGDRHAAGAGDPGALGGLNAGSFGLPGFVFSESSL